MARAVFVESLFAQDTEGDAYPLENITVEVFNAGSTTTGPTVYSDRTSGIVKAAAGGSFTTPATGLVLFWLDEGDYDVRFTDNTGLNRASQYTVGFQAINPTSVALLALGIVPIGAQMAWVGTGDPVGVDGRFLSCDGRTVSSATHPVLDSMIGATAPIGQAHKYNAGVSPGAGLIRIPDKRRRVSVGPNDAGTAMGTVVDAPTLAQGSKGGKDTSVYTDFGLDNNINSSGDGSRNTTDPRFGPVEGNNLQPYEVDNWIIRVR